MKWLDEQELKKLKEVWAFASRDEIRELIPDRRFASLAVRARKLGLKSEQHKNSKGNLKPLLSESYQAYYWLGFIIADGYLSKQNALSVCLSAKDKAHLQRLADFLKTQIRERLVEKNDKINSSETSVVKISVGDAVLVPKIREKFGMEKTNKTYNPPVIPAMNRERFLSFLAGYIDGDGCISKQGNYGKYERRDVVIQVKCHSSWLEIVCEMEKRLYEELNFNLEKTHVRINKEGYTFWRLSNNKVIKRLKLELMTLKLPLMERKWSKINL